MRFSTHPFIFALQLLTRIPIPISVPVTPELQGRSVLFYPLVGAVIGGILCLPIWFFSFFVPEINPLFTAILILLIWVGITGGLHLDGLADSADAWVGGMGSRERALEIMKDPACGPMCVIVLVLVLLTKFAALVVLVPTENVWLLFWIPILARASAVFLLQTMPYIRSGGMGETAASRLPKKIAILMQILVFGLAIFSGFPILLLILLWGTFFLFRQKVKKWLGGITGDLIGALIEKTELFLLLWLGVLFSI